MYLGTCQARGLGKLCSQRTTTFKILGYVFVSLPHVFRPRIVEETWIRAYTSFVIVKKSYGREKVHIASAI